MFGNDTHYLISPDPQSPRILCDAEDWGTATRNAKQITCIECAAIYELDDPEDWPIKERPRS